MKKPNSQVEREELQKLAGALSTHKKLVAERDKFTALQSAISSEVESFANSGDLLDVEAVSAIATKQLQVTLVAKRIDSLGAKLDTSEAELATAAETVGRLLIGDLNQLKNGVIEQVALSMRPHFADFQDCRRQAAQSNSARDVALRINNFEGSKFEETVPLAERYLSIAPEITAEVEKMRAALGGAIPSASELAAV